MTHLTESQFRKLKGKPKKFEAYRPRRIDANQPDIVETLRKLGFMVQSLHEVGKGVFDLLVSKHGLNILVEVKTGLIPRPRANSPMRSAASISHGRACAASSPATPIACAWPRRSV